MIRVVVIFNLSAPGAAKFENPLALSNKSGFSVDNFVDRTLIDENLTSADISEGQLRPRLLSNSLRQRIIPSSEIDKGALKTMKWFDAVIAGKQHTDFFANRVTNYSKGHLQWDESIF